MSDNPQFRKKFTEVLESWTEATTAGKTEDAQTAALQLLAMAGEEALRNPSPSLLLKNEAYDLECKGAWAEAEIARRKILAVEESSGNIGLIAKAQMDLSRLLRLIGRSDEAMQFACAATVTVRSSKNCVLRVMALSGEILCALDRGDSAKALAAAEEAVQIIEPGKLADQLRARALTIRAKCLLAHGDPTAAESDLTSAWELLQANCGSWMSPGLIWKLANWWEVKSQLEQQLGNSFHAREAITHSIEHYRQSEGLYSLLGLAQALEKLGGILRADDDLGGAEAALSEAKSIRTNLHLPAGI